MAAERLQKIMAAAGIASRRKAEEIIAAGRVTLNGKVVTEQGTKADPEVSGRAEEGAPGRVPFPEPSALWQRGAARPGPVEVLREPPGLPGRDVRAGQGRTRARHGRRKSFGALGNDAGRIGQCGAAESG